MVKATFINLPASKKKIIRQSLVNEFSTYPLAKAQVARIVAQAGIARGAFYKYFTDLNDAYQYMYKIAIKAVHSPVELTSAFEPQQYYQNVANFIEKAQQSSYAGLIKMHILYNENSVGQPYPRELITKLDPQNWSAMVLSHATIRLVMENPEQEKEVMARFKSSLELLKRGTN